VFRTTRKDEIFYDLFVNTAELTCEAARRLDDLANNYVDIDAKIDAIEEIEHQCDQNIHDIIKQLNKSFITPIDREDIYAIAKEIDNITDAIEASAHRLRMFNVKTIPDDAKQLSHMIVLCTKELKDLMCELKNMKTSQVLPQKIIEVNRLENEGDDLYRLAIAHLFTNGQDTIHVIKWKEIYEFLENTLDACEDVANIIDGVVMKNA
jgi:uncharacterized protein